MAKDWRKKVVLLKTETTEGTDAAPSSAANAIQVLNFEMNFMDADQKVRAIEKAYFGADPVGLASFKRGATWDMELSGSGTATGVPGWMTALRVAGFGAPTIGATEAAVTPTPSPSAGTLWSYLDNLLLKAAGGRAGVSFMVQDDEYPMLSFDYMGIPPIAMAEEATPTAPTLTAFRAPVLATSENSTFTLDGFALPLRSWQMSDNSERELRSLIGPADRVNYADRSWSGTILAELPDLTAKNYFSSIRTDDTMEASFVNGTVTGDIVGIIGPKLQISGNVALSEEQGKIMVSLPVTALPINGNDEIMFVAQ